MPEVVDQTQRFRKAAMAWLGAMLVAQGVLAVLVTHAPWLQAMDSNLSAGLALAERDPLRMVVTWVTWLGSGNVVLPVMLLASLVLWFQGRRSLLVAQWGGFAGARIVTDGLKHLIGRPRPGPEELGFINEHWNTLSFPSGHTTSALYLYGFLVLLLLRSGATSNLKASAVFMAVLVVLSVGLSRILLGMHFASDVLGGVISGTIGLMVAVLIQGGPQQHIGPT